MHVSSRVSAQRQGRLRAGRVTRAGERVGCANWATHAGLGKRNTNATARHAKLRMESWKKRGRIHILNTERVPSEVYCTKTSPCGRRGNL